MSSWWITRKNVNYIFGLCPRTLACYILETFFGVSSSFRWKNSWWRISSCRRVSRSNMGSDGFKIFHIEDCTSVCLSPFENRWNFSTSSQVRSRFYFSALNSFCGSFVALSIVPSYKVEEYYPQLWYLDDVSGLAISSFLLIYGIVWVIFISDSCFTIA